MTGSELRDWMEANRVQSTELARLLGVTQPRVTALCKSERLSEYMAARIATVQAQIAREDLLRASAQLASAPSGTSGDHQEREQVAA